VYGFITKKNIFSQNRYFYLGFVGKNGIFQHAKFVKYFVYAFKQDEADVWFVNENLWKKTLEVEGIERDMEVQDCSILTGQVKALLQPHVMFTYHYVEWFAWALWLQCIQNAHIGLLLTYLRFKKKEK
jgi:hypothetical protein